MTPDAQATPVSWLVAYERLRMPLLAMGWAIYPGMLLLLVLLLALEAPCDVVAFRWWCGVAALTWLTEAYHARWWLKRTLDPVLAERLTLELKALYAVEGIVWGALPWVTLDGCVAILSALAIATNAGVAASRMMLLSSVPEVFLGYILLGGAVWVTKMFAVDDLPLVAMGVIGGLYVMTLIFQARVHARMLENAIELRFENRDLLDKLNAQIDFVETARCQAEEANAAKSKFLAAASHDLRQPAHAQGLYLDLLSRSPLDERQRDLLDNVRMLAGTSARMLDTLLDYSRVEAGAVVPQRQNFALQPLLHQIEREFGPQADAKELFYRTRDTQLLAYSDPKQVELILRNLVANAIRYTRSGGVLVSCRRRRGEIELAVWDTGIGIAPGQQALVFKEFLQLGNPEHDGQKGFGLGLAIVAGLTQALGHRLTLHSRPGRGSVFRLLLPTATAMPAPVKTQPDVPLRVRHGHVLVVDDDPLIRDGMCQLLESWAYSCHAAEGVEDALERARQRTPDLLIVDFRLRGDQTGNDVVSALRKRLGNHLPALLITGETSPEHLRIARNSGIPVVHKPIAPETLRRELDRLLGGAQLRLVESEENADAAKREANGQAVT